MEDLYQYLLLRKNLQINRKRKVRILCIRANTIEELNEYKSKRLKPINYDFVNEHRLFRKEIDQNEFEQGLKKLRKHLKQ